MKRLLFICFFLLSMGYAGERALAEEGVDESPALKSQLLVDKGGSLVGRRTISIEPGLDYTHISSNQLEITGFSVLPDLVVGMIQVQKVRRDILVPSITFRAGVTSAFEVNLRIPYSVREDTYTIGAGSDIEAIDVSESGLGDIEGGISIHLLKEKESRPQVMLGFRVKSRTGRDPYGLQTQVLSSVEIPAELPLGSGHWALEPNITLVKTVDPAVLFFNLGYYMHLERKTHIPDVGKVDPSDSIGYSLGMAYALNEKVALSTAFEQKFFTKAEQETLERGKVKIPNSDIVLATLMMSGTYVLTETLSVNASVGIGLTEDSPDLQVGIKFPMRFSGL